MLFPVQARTCIEPYMPCGTENQESYEFSRTPFWRVGSGSGVTPDENAVYFWISQAR
jgi:hypothetical protein